MKVDTFIISSLHLRLHINTDTIEVPYGLIHCRMIETARFTTFGCHNEPTYVLSRKCTNQYYGGAGPCCKVDEIMSFVSVDKPALYAHTKYVLHCDDDSYFRVDQVLRWLAAIENYSGLNSYPLIAELNTRADSIQQRGSYGIKSGWFLFFFLFVSSLTDIIVIMGCRLPGDHAHGVVPAHDDQPRRPGEDEERAPELRADEHVQCDRSDARRGHG